jgi:dimethylamine monooxygenase subunit A
MTVDWLTPASRMPWPVSAPFRMRPNLEKLDPENPALFLKDDLADVYRERRRELLRAHRERCIVTRKADREMREMQALREALLRRYLPDISPRAFDLVYPLDDVALTLQEDFVILKNENDTLRTEYLSVCFPSRWDPREKLGLDFSQIHAPVADNQMLLAAGPSIMTMAFMKQPMLRHVWLIVPSASLAQHPEQNDYSWSETLKDQSPLLPRLFFRVERQTTWPLPTFSRAVFFIRVMMSPLIDVLNEAPGRAAELAAALRSMTPAIVAYRGMTDALPRLLTELDTHA